MKSQPTTDNNNNNNKNHKKNGKNNNAQLKRSWEKLKISRLRQANILEMQHSCLDSFFAFEKSVVLSSWFPFMISFIG